jgi:hypothetical protein
MAGKPEDWDERNAPCSTSPSMLYFVGGAVLLVVGAVLVLPSSRRPYGAR